MRSKGQKPTVSDVANAARVSKATAARVLGGYGIASEETRQAVQRAARELGYQPNALARSMSTGRSGLIGVVVGDIENAFFSQAVRGVSDAARQHGLNVIVANSGEDPAQEQELVSLLLRQRVEGLIVAPTDDRRIEHLRQALAARTPVVTLDRWVPGLGADAVCGSDRAAAVAVMARLHALGHRRVAYVSAVRTAQRHPRDLEEVAISAVRERMQGFLGFQGLEGHGNNRIYTGAVEAEATDAIVAEILAEAPRITAILASDSLVGANVHKSLADRGLEIPGDMSLVTWFDADWTRLVRPAVTIVDQPTHRFGVEALELLVQRIAGGDQPVIKRDIPTPLIERQSHGAPGKETP